MGMVRMTKKQSKTIQTPERSKGNGSITVSRRWKKSHCKGKAKEKDIWHLAE